MVHQTVDVKEFRELFDCPSYNCSVVLTRSRLTWIVCLEAKDRYPPVGHSNCVLKHGVD
jgi:hypothetical protein